jgi:hypothetical protein
VNIKVIVELVAKQGRGAELKSLLERVVATLGSRARLPGQHVLRGGRLPRHPG